MYLKVMSFTVQGLFLFKEFHAYNGVNVNMSLFQGPMLPYTRIDAGKIQVKNGGGDSPDDWALTSEIAKDKWCQITFTYKDSYLKLYVNGKLIKTYQRPSLKVSPGMRINIEILKLHILLIVISANLEYGTECLQMLK